MLAAGQPGQTLGGGGLPSPILLAPFHTPLSTFHPLSRSFSKELLTPPQTSSSVSRSPSPCPVPPSTESSTCLNQGPTHKMNNP